MTKCFHAADRCPPLPHLNGTKQMTALAHSGSSVEIVCEKGRQFEEGIYTHTARCDGNVWIYTVTGCQS